MVKPTWTPTTISSLEQGWDADLDDNLTDLKDIIEEAWPLEEYASTGALPTASNNDRSLAALNDATAGWIPVFSDGTNWLEIGTQAAAVADLNQTIAGPSIAEVQAISDKVDELLAAMRATALLAP